MNQGKLGMVQQQMVRAQNAGLGFNHKNDRMILVPVQGNSFIITDIQE